ncbi:DUF1178 family protein [Blastochloris sulfoviridis]|uniref:DUF1178 family protein n=1 Tax=Blastochloris sulfoviridis TaxID=50712 RepID=A0A5M6HQZ3_9HYPH|nr:DUF1178 family protein [Blastochloris sulfoviridis]KAA5598276.1 DUF1178 family protein [Blastochloris sulfoviridis]
MIRYALRCEAGHAFESWFPSFEAFEQQRQRGLVACPLCGSAKVEKQLMAPSVVRAGRESPAPAPLPAQPVALMAPEDQELRAKLQALRTHLTENSDYVGPSFSDEARRMHAGESAHRSIWGEATAEDARALVEDGIEVVPLPPAFEDCN